MKFKVVPGTVADGSPESVCANEGMASAAIAQAKTKIDFLIETPFKLYAQSMFRLVIKPVKLSLRYLIVRSSCLEHLHFQRYNCR